MSFPRYKRYKESGVKWLGEVPEGWEVKTLKQIVATPITDGPHETPVFLDEGIPFVSAEAVSSGKIDFSKIRGFISETVHKGYSQKYYPQLGDIYMVKSGATTGITAIVDTDIEFNIWSPLAAIRCGVKAVPQFVLNFMRSKNFQEAVTLNWSFGTQQNIGMGVIENLSIVMPPLPEQRNIATFLDRETGKIDALVAEQERLIVLLKEKRQAVISHAVTKGLNPDAPMKDSGIEWLGEVPEGWEVKKLKHIKATSPNAFVDGPFGSNLKSQHFIDGGDVYVIESNFATQGKLDPDELKTISAEHFATIQRSETKAGDIIIAKIGAQFGKATILPAIEKSAVVSGNSMKLTVNNAVCSTLWAYWQLFNLKVSGEIGLLVNGSAQPALSLSAMNELVFLLPPPEEQATIVAFLNSETDKIDTLVGEAQHTIGLLKERRSALISAAVTGKIDVRGVVL